MSLPSRQDILSEITEVDWPTLRRFADLLYSTSDGTLEVGSREQAPFLIPGQRGYIFFFGFWMESKRLTSHVSGCGPSAEPLPMRQFLLHLIGPDRGGVRPPAAMRHP